MHTFFRVLAESLAAARVEQGAPTERILFRLITLHDERWVVELGPAGCRVAHARDEDADLTVYCDRAQLDAMVTRGHSDRPLRFSGRREVLDRLVNLARPPVSWLDARRGTV